TSRPRCCRRATRTRRWRPWPWATRTGSSGKSRNGWRDDENGHRLRAGAASSVRRSAQDSTRISEAQAVLAPLVESYGVSGTEGPVRETVKRLLPAWATPSTDTAGNLWVRVGQGNPVVVFVAHLDEIGFRVTGTRDDGTLELETRGGFILSLFEAQPALV